MSSKWITCSMGICSSFRGILNNNISNYCKGDRDLVNANALQANKLIHSLVVAGAQLCPSVVCVTKTLSINTRGTDWSRLMLFFFVLAITINWNQSQCPPLLRPLDDIYHLYYFFSSLNPLKVTRDTKCNTQLNLTKIYIPRYIVQNLTTRWIIKVIDWCT